MSDLKRPDVIHHFRAASDSLLAAILDQSIDCVKLIGIDGAVEYMNRSGQCAMEIDDFATISGKPWWSLWPSEAQGQIHESVLLATGGECSRFEAFCPTAKGNPRWWDVSVSPVKDAGGALRGLVSVSRDISELVAARSANEALAGEMAHRLRNAYAVTSALLSAFARGDEERERFAQEVAERFTRLGKAQTLMLATEGGSVQLAALVSELTQPFDNNIACITIDTLPEAEIGARKLQPLALLIGELCTNSVHHGALGNGGTIAISGALEEERLILRWCERSDRAMVDAGDTTGFDLLGRLLRAQKGALDLKHRANGLDAAISVPLN
jgi:PAS domain S-box-containing protein